MVRVGSKKWVMSLTHYAIVFAVLVLAWVPLMEFFQDQVMPTIAAGFMVFVVTDQLVHRYFLGDQYTLW